MSSSIPPNPWFSTINYNPEFFSSNTQTITLAYANATYLKRIGIATSVASSTTFSGGEVAGPSFTSLSSGATTFHFDNLAGNNAPLIIRNQRTDQNTIYRQFGTTNSHVFQTNGTGTTNLTLSNTVNTSSRQTIVSLASGGTASQTFVVRDTTSGQNLVTIPATTSGNLGPFCRPGDVQLVALGSAPGNTNLTIMPYSNNTVGLRMTDTDVLLGAGGTASFTPTCNIFINATNVSITGLTVFSTNIRLQLTQPTNTVNYLGYTVKQNGTNVGAITTGVAYNINATGLSLTPGVYIFNIMINNSKDRTLAGDVNVIQVGISTSAVNFVGGATTLIKGQQTYVVSGTNQDVIGNGSFTFSVPTTATYYLLQQVSHTFGAVLFLGTTNSYWQYTRVA